MTHLYSHAVSLSLNGLNKDTKQAIKDAAGSDIDIDIDDNNSNEDEDESNDEDEDDSNDDDIDSFFSAENSD